jgi:ParB family chromosome partitioning protein
VEIAVDQIEPNPLQPRAHLEEEPLVELAASIREQGVLQPVLVRPAPGRPGKFELVAGERRWRAAAAAGLRTIPAVLRHLDDRGALEAALVENLQREDLGPLERARAYRRLLEDFGLKQDDIARRVGRSQPAIANTLRLLGLPQEILTSLESGRITEGHARALLAVEDGARMLDVWRKVEERGLSVRSTEEMVRRATISREIPTKKSRAASRDISNIEQDLSGKLGTQVRLAVRSGGTGEIRIAFYSIEELDRLVEVLAGGPRA